MVFYSYEVPQNYYLYVTIYVTSGITVTVELFVLVTFWRQLCQVKREYTSFWWELLSIRTLSLIAMICALLTIITADLGVHFGDIRILVVASFFEIVFILLYLIVYILRLHGTFNNSIYRMSKKETIFYLFLLALITFIFIFTVIFRSVTSMGYSILIDILSVAHWLIVGIISISVCYTFNKKLYLLYIAQRSSIVYNMNPKVSDVGTMTTLGAINDVIDDNTNISTDANVGVSYNIYNNDGSYVGSIEKMETQRIDPSEQQGMVLNSIAKQALLVTIGIIASLLIVFTSVDWLFVNNKSLLLVAYEFVFLHCFFQMTIIITLWLSFKFSNKFYKRFCSKCEKCWQNCCIKILPSEERNSRKNTSGDYQELSEV